MKKHNSLDFVLIERLLVGEITRCAFKLNLEIKFRVPFLYYECTSAYLFVIVIYVFTFFFFFPVAGSQQTSL